MYIPFEPATSSSRVVLQHNFLIHKQVTVDTATAAGCLQFDWHKIMRSIKRYTSQRELLKGDKFVFAATYRKLLQEAVNM